MKNTPDSVNLGLNVPFQSLIGAANGDPAARHDRHRNSDAVTCNLDILPTSLSHVSNILRSL